VMNRYVRNLPAMPGVFSGLSGACRPQRRRGA
jgi:hypothetical protein